MQEELTTINDHFVLWFRENFGQFQLGCWRFLFNLTHSIPLWCSVFLLIPYNCLVILQGGLAIQWLDGTMWNGTDGYYLCWTTTGQNAGCLLFTPMGGQRGPDYEQYLLEQKLSSLWTWAFLQPLQVFTHPQPRNLQLSILGLFSLFLITFPLRNPFSLGTALLHIFLTLSNMRAETRLLLFSFSLHFKCLL